MAIVTQVSDVAHGSPVLLLLLPQRTNGLMFYNFNHKLNSLHLWKVHGYNGFMLYLSLHGCGQDVCYVSKGINIIFRPVESLVIFLSIGMNYTACLIKRNMPFTFYERNYW